MTDTSQAGYVLPPGYEIKKKKRFYKKFWFWLLLIVVAVVIAIIAAIASAADDAVNAEHKVSYKVTGTAKQADISYSIDPGSGQSESKSEDNVTLPFAKEFTAKGDLSVFQVSADELGLADTVGTLACELTVDGKVVATDQAKGDTKFVSCTASGYDAD